MNTKDSFSNSIYDDEMRKAERELSAFISAVTELFDPEQARLSAEDWLDELELMSSPLRAEECNWRAVTIAASTRLANRLNVARHDGSVSTDTQATPILSPNYYAVMLMP